MIDIDIERVLKEEAEEEVRQNILRFWQSRGVDKENGGFFGYIDNDLGVDKEAPKGAVLNARILWTYSKAYNIFKEDEYLKMANVAYEYIKNYLWDKEFEGLFWLVDYKGEPLNTKKQIYAQAFGIYALVEYYRAVNSKESLDIAIKLYNLIEKHSYDIDYKGYFEACSRNWEPTEDLQLSEVDMNEKKSMNTHLHVLEAYTSLYGVWKNKDFKLRFKELIEITLDYIIDKSSFHFKLFFDEAWNSKSKVISYGHDIEGSWLLVEAAETLGDKDLSNYIEKISISMAQKVYEEAINKDGSIINEMTQEGDLDKTRVWWVQAEGVVGFLNAYQLTKKQYFLEAAYNTWKYIRDHIVDKKKGEWFWGLSENNEIKNEKPKVSPWKCPYHNSRTCFEIIKRTMKGNTSEINMNPGKEFDERLKKLLRQYEKLINCQNEKLEDTNGVFFRYKYPVLTKDHTPIFWKYDLDMDTNPYLMERLGINAVFNAGAIELNNKFYLVARVEGNDRKSFFAVAESDTGIDGFRFWDYPILMPETKNPDTNVYDMRLVKHEDGWIYGLFCTERKNLNVPLGDTSSAIAQCGIARTKDLKHWERLPDLVTKSPQQRNVVLHPEFINGKYAFYTRPQDDFIEAGSGGGIGFGFSKSMENPIIDEERIIDEKVYHTIKEVKNGQGAAPIKTAKGWLHIAHGVRNTAAGLRYVLYAFLTDLKKPDEVISAPGGYLIAPEGEERIGDVLNVVFCNGVIARKSGEIYIYYASSDTRTHVATTTVDRLLDYVLNTPSDPLYSYACVKQRYELIDKNLKLMKS